MKKMTKKELLKLIKWSENEIIEYQKFIKELKNELKKYGSQT